jgi:hypothetical protein
MKCAHCDGELKEIFLKTIDSTERVALKCQICGRIKLTELNNHDKV